MLPSGGQNRYHRVGALLLCGVMAVAVSACSATKEGLVDKARQGDADAQTNLGRMYYEGKGVPRDYSEAARWIHKAAGQGLAEAQFNLGIMYIEGNGVPQDDEEAVHWLHKSAEQGMPAAQAALGWKYKEGQGVRQDRVQAYKWLTLAIVRDERYEKYRSTMAEDMTPQQVAEAQRLAQQWEAKRQEIGHP